MRITEARVHPRRVPITVPYRIAGHTFDTSEIVFLVLKDEEGLEGYGSCSPIPHLTGDDFEGVTRLLEESIVPVLLGSEIRHLEGALASAALGAQGSPCALAAVDIALHDLAAKRRGVPLAAMLGGAKRRLMTSVTVGITDTGSALAQARAFVEKGFRHLKIKIGEDAAADVERVRALRREVGPGIAIRVDANEGYDAATALEVAGEMKALGVELIEQPVGRADVEGLARVAAGSEVPIVLDESVRVAAQLPPLVAARAGHGANIKLMKCGGILEARMIDSWLADAGWRALVGCMDESRVSIAAAAHFAAAADSVAWIDLDGHFDLAADPFEGGVGLSGGELLLGTAPGLGVTLRDLG